MSPQQLPLYHFEGTTQKGSDFDVLPPEILHNILASYQDWGDLAKLANVQSSWKNLVNDAAANNEDSKWELAVALLEGTNGLARNPKKAFNLLAELAEPSSNHAASAMNKLAHCCLTGDGVSKDTTAGIEWLTKAYDIAQDAHAAHTLAVTYEYGEHGVEIDVVEACAWFLKAAEKNHVEAMAEYALCCELGCGRDQSDEDALTWYVKAANAGHVTSKFSVGEAFEEARGVPQSDEEACLWYYRAAVEGDEDSKRALRRLRDIARIVVPGVGGLLGV